MHEYFKLIILVDTKASKLEHLRKATHPGTDIILIPTKVNIHRDFVIFTAISVYSTEWHIVYSLRQRQRCNMLSIAIFICQCHQPNTDLVTKNGESEELQ